MFPKVILLVLSLYDHTFLFFLNLGELPFWAYIIIAVGVILIVVAVVAILYGRVDRW